MKRREVTIRLRLVDQRANEVPDRLSSVLPSIGTSLPRVRSRSTAHPTSKREIMEAACSTVRGTGLAPSGQRRGALAPAGYRSRCDPELQGSTDEAVLRGTSCHGLSGVCDAWRVGSGLVLKGAALKPLRQGSHRYETRVAAECAFPNSSDAPTGFKELTLGTAVALHIVVELRLPEFRPCRWGRRIRAPFMAVPEAAVNEANRAVPTQDKVRGPGHTANVESEAEPLCVKCASKDKFGLGVLGRYARHHPRSSGLVYDVGHRVGGPRVQVARTHDFTRGCEREQVAAADGGWIAWS